MTSITSQVPRLFLLEVARGAVPGYVPSGFLGINPSVGSTFETAWDEGGNFVYPTAGETWEVVSDDVNDTNSSGTGARQVIISGLDDQYVEQTEIVELDGTTPVVTARTDWFRIYSVIVIFSGSSTWNEGTITLRVSGGGLVRSKMLPTMARTFNGFFTVPVGKTLFILDAQIFIPKNEDVTARNRIRIFGTDTFIAGGDAEVYQNNARVEFSAIPTMPEKTDLESTMKSTNTSVKVAISVQAILANTGTSGPSPFMGGL